MFLFFVYIKYITNIHTNKMVLSGAKKTSYSSSRTNINSGGGNKKAGFPYQIGRSSWVSQDINSCNITSSAKCCGLKQLNTNPAWMPCVSRGIGRNFNPSYWKCNGVPNTK